jgi:hypothetical protein
LNYQIQKTAITSDEIEKCIAILAQLNSDTDQILISQRTTNGFNQSGWNVFSDLIVTSFLNAKDGKLVAKRKKKSKIEPQGRKPEFGLHVKRLFYSTKAFALMIWQAKNN